MKNRKSGDAGMKYDPAQVRIHEAYTVAIRDLGVHGEGIGSVDGFTVFVPGALPGETVTAEITLLKKSYALGKLLSIEQKSPFRMVPECSVYENCGGCQLSHLTYEGQLDMKYRRVKDVIERIAGESGKLVRPVLPAAHPFAYRNKMAVPAGLVKGKAALGCYRQGSHDIISVSSCAIQKEENNRLLRFARRFIEKYGISVYDEKTRKGSLRHVLGRVGDGGKMMVVLVTASEILPEEERWIEEIKKELPEVVSLWHNIQPQPGNTILGAKIRHLWGRETLTASLCGLQFEVSPYSFFQVHKEQAEILYEKALAYADLKGGETVIDAYCGTGTISLCLAKKAKRVIGIEIVKPAIEDAKKNAKKNAKKEPYGKYGILRGRRGKTYAAALPARAGSRCDRHGSRQSRLQRRSIKGGGRHESQAYRLCFLQSRHLCQRCEDFKIGRLRNQRSPAGGHVPPDHACGDSGLDDTREKQIRIDLSRIRAFSVLTYLEIRCNYGWNPLFLCAYETRNTVE